MKAFTLTDIKGFTSHLFLKDTFDSFQFIEGEVVTFNTFRIDGYIQKEFFDTGAELPEYSYWKKHKRVLFLHHPRETYAAQLPLCTEPFPPEYRPACRTGSPFHKPERGPGPLSQHPL